MRYQVDVVDEEGETIIENLTRCDTFTKAANEGGRIRIRPVQEGRR